MRKKQLRRILTRPLENLGTQSLFSIASRMKFEHLPQLASTLTNAYLRLCKQCSGKARQNLHRAFPNLPPLEQQLITRLSFQSAVLTYLEQFWLSEHHDQISEKVTIDADLLHELTQLQCHGHGLIAVSAQLGNWEAGAMALSAYGFQVAQVNRPIRNPFVSRMVNNARQLLGTELISAEQPARPFIRQLMQGKIVGIHLDVNTKPEKGGVYHTFFNHEVPISRLPASVALKHRHPIKVIACIRKNGHLHIVQESLNQPIHALKEYELSALLLEKIEKLIRKYPDQWFWRYDRFRYARSSHQPNESDGFMSIDK